MKVSKSSRSNSTRRPSRILDSLPSAARRSSILGLMPKYRAALGRSRYRATGSAVSTDMLIWASPLILLKTGPCTDTTLAAYYTTRTQQHKIVAAKRHGVNTPEWAGVMTEPKKCNELAESNTPGALSRFRALPKTQKSLAPGKTSRRVPISAVSAPVQNVTPCHFLCPARLGVPTSPRTRRVLGNAKAPSALRTESGSLATALSNCTSGSSMLPCCGRWAGMRNVGGRGGSPPAERRQKANVPLDGLSGRCGPVSWPLTVDRVGSSPGSP